jgi:Uma2 family endonuclease
MRVLVSASGLYTYPDAVVYCGEPRLPDNQRDTLLNPILIIEVLSPSTEGYNRGRKFEHYQSIGSLREYLMVASDRAHADLFTRQTDDRWLLTSAKRLEDSLDLQSISRSLSLDALYEKVDLSELAA